MYSNCSTPIFALAVLLAAMPAGTFSASAPVDAVIVGATPAGVAAAIAARRSGAEQVVLVEPSSHVGGRFAETLGFDEENRMDPQAVGGLWKELRDRVNKHYGREVKGPEPHVNERIIEDWLAGEKVTVLTGFVPRRVLKTDARLSGIEAADGRSVSGKIFVDATYMGDVLPLAGVSTTVGREPRSQYGESLAGVALSLKNPPGRIVTDIFASPVDATVDGRLLPHVQGWVKDVEKGGGDRHLQCANLLMCLTKDPKNRVEWTEPKNYDPAEFELLRREFRSGRLKNFSLGAGAIPNGKNKLNDAVKALLHWGLVGGGDAWPEAGPGERRKIWEAHRDYTHRMFWFLIHDESVPQSIRKQIGPWGRPKDEFVDNDHWPWTIYAREGRRVIGDFVMTQKDLFDDVRKPDAVAVGCFPVDSHAVRRLARPDGGVVNEGGYLVQPPIYDIPFRALLPKSRECENLLVPVALSCSRVAYNSLRVEPTWMATGTAAGAAAALAARSDRSVHALDITTLQAELAKLDQPMINSAK